ncbi:hypothetical protein KY290_007549 [Solanum tuberosum]|uniref:Uncharacterized protein n=1 Tax=Solanum tuberosum TaxID=4113 RepID=A0ABQ7W5W5_SOLTU|nr:hypothetical protein KY290_007549 [Solanum tuberosum]
MERGGGRAARYWGRPEEQQLGISSRGGRGTGSARPGPRPVREPARRTRSRMKMAGWGLSG